MVLGLKILLLKMVLDVIIVLSAKMIDVAFLFIGSSCRLEVVVFLFSFFCFKNTLFGQDLSMV